MTKTSWGTKRNCIKCSVAFYDLKKSPATCPKCGAEFDPATEIKTKRKLVKKSADETNSNSKISAKKPPQDLDDEIERKTLSDLIEIDDLDSLENLDELSELEEMEEETINDEDDADDEALIEELDTGGNDLINNIEDEEALAFEEIDDENSGN